MKVISDSSTLIGLARIDQLSLLETLYGEVIIPSGVFNEVLKETKPGSNKIKHAPYIKTEKVKDAISVDFLIANLGKGEAESLVLAREKRADLILIDERKARKIARRAGFKVMGVLGVLLTAKHRGVIPHIKPFIKELNRHGFRLSNKVIQETLKEAKEI